MLLRDFLRLTTGSLRSQRMRSILAALGISIGITSVILLTSIGQGVHNYVLHEFTQFGSNLIVVEPGHIITSGIPAPIGIFATVRPLTIDDAEALRHAPYVLMTDAVVQGNAEIAANGKRRRVNLFGVSPDMPVVLHLNVGMGSFLPRDDQHAPRALAVLGSQAREELFGDANPLGSRIDVGGRRFRIVGVMESKGQMLGMELNDGIFIPAQRAQELFNREGLIGMHVIYDPQAPPDKVVEGIRRMMIARHGREDFTIITQKQMQDVAASVLGVLTFAVAALGSISLLVGGVGILTIMTIAVSERKTEIGMLRALGAGRGQVMALFLAEAAFLAAAGGVSGLALGAGMAQLIRMLIPSLPVVTPWSYAALAEAVATVTGVIAGILPARNAARMDPIEALRAE